LRLTHFASKKWRLLNSSQLLTYAVRSNTDATIAKRLHHGDISRNPQYTLMWKSTCARRISHNVRTQVADIGTSLAITR
jgi:hypothetical protein